MVYKNLGALPKTPPLLKKWAKLLFFILNPLSLDRWKFILYYMYICKRSGFMKTKTAAIVTAIGAAACYGVSSPVSKLLLLKISPTLLAALLYLGAGIGMFFVGIIRNARNTEHFEAKITKSELPYVIAMVVLDIAAPIFLMIGISMSSPASVSLLNNFEIVVTSMIALLIFKESIGKRAWLSIGLITVACIILSFEGAGGLSFSVGSIFVIAACLCWGFENNCTRMLSLKDPLQIVVIKGLGSGAGSLSIAFYLKEFSGDFLYIAFALMLGFFAYGLSVFLYILAQRELGAARTSAYYAVAPFIGVIISFLVFRTSVSLSFGVAFVIMIIGTYFGAVEHHNHEHVHEEIEHEHRHSHDDLHHLHTHEHENEVDLKKEHSHMHKHTNVAHSHHHLPDLHHTHAH